MKSSGTLGDVEVPVVRESDEVTGFYDLITDARLALDGRALSIGVNSIVIRNADF